MLWSDDTWTHFHQYLIQGCSIPFANRILESHGPCMQDLVSKRGERKWSFQRHYFLRGCPEVLQCFTTLPPEPTSWTKATPRHWWPSLPCTWWPHHKTHICNWEISDATLLNLHNSSTYHTLQGGALQFLGIKYTLRVPCFYEPLLGKVNAISLRLVMINTTAHLPP